jgi:hypothetical protein
MELLREILVNGISSADMPGSDLTPASLTSCGHTGFDAPQHIEQVRLDNAVKGAPVLGSRGDQIGGPQDPQLLRDNRLRDLQPFGETIDMDFASAEHTDDSQPQGMGQRLEQFGCHRRLLLTQFDDSCPGSHIALSLYRRFSIVYRQNQVPKREKGMPGKGLKKGKCYFRFSKK